jgi:hypothetical protein
MVGAAEPAAVVSMVAQLSSSPTIRPKPGIWRPEWASFGLAGGSCRNPGPRRSNSSCPGTRSSRVVESLRLALAIALGSCRIAKPHQFSLGGDALYLAARRLQLRPRPDCGGYDRSGTGNPSG